METVKTKIPALTKKNTVLWQLLGAVSLICAWQFFAVFLDQSYILPAPGTVLRKLFTLFKGPETGVILLSTLWRWLAGILPAALLGMAAGIAAGIFKPVDGFLAPLLTLVRSVPIVAVILLALVWLKAPNVPSFAVFLATFPAVFENTSSGVRNVDRKLLVMAEVYHFSLAGKVLRIYLPSLLPYLFAALKAGLGIGLKAVIVAELVVQPIHSVGEQMQIARVSLQTDLLLAWTALLVLIGYAADRAARGLETGLQPWRRRT